MCKRLSVLVALTAIAFSTLALAAPTLALAETVLDNEFTKVTPGLGVRDFKSYPGLIVGAGDVTCIGFAISQDGARGMSRVSSEPSAPVTKTFVGDGPHDLTVGFNWPTEWTDGQLIQPGEVRTGRLFCTRPDPDPDPGPDVKPKSFTDLSIA